MEETKVSKDNHKKQTNEYQTARMFPDNMSRDISKIKMKYSLYKLSAPSLPHHSEGLEAGRYHADLETST